jgi:pilus assembly protein CpaE
MRLMIAGLSETDSKIIFDALRPAIEHGGALPDWRHLEKAVEQARPEAVLLYLGARPGQALAMARRIMTVYPNVKFVGLADAESPELVQLAAEAGLADLAVLTNGTADLIAALQRLVARKAEAHVADGIVVALIGAKGGVGTTTLAINLAAELAADPKANVILVDLHLYLGDVAANLDLVPDPSALWFLTRGGQASGRMWTTGPPTHRAGFRVLGLDGDLRNAEQANAEQVVFLLDALRTHYDYVVIDCGSNLGEISLAACSAADQRYIVLTDELSSLLGARRRVIALQALELPSPVAGGLLNRGAPGADLPAIEDASGLKVVGQVANAWRDVYGAMERAQVLREAAPSSAVRGDIARLAQMIAGHDVSDTRKKRAFFSFFR